MVADTADAPAVAERTKAPVVAAAVRVGAVATPSPSVATVAAAAPPAKVAVAVGLPAPPAGGALNVTGAPDTGFPLASRTATLRSPTYGASVSAVWSGSTRTTIAAGAPARLV